LPDNLPCGFFPFGVLMMTGSHFPQGYPPPGFCSLLSVSHARKVLLRPPSAGLVSCRSRPWGFPSGPISTRRAVRSFERRYPLVVESRRTPTSGSCSLRVSLSPAAAAVGDSDPPGIDLLRGISLFAVVRRPSSPELGGQRAKACRPPLFRVLPTKRLAGLSRVCHPFRGFFTLSATQRLTR